MSSPSAQKFFFDREMSLASLQPNFSLPANSVEALHAYVRCHAVMGTHSDLLVSAERTLVISIYRHPPNGIYIMIE